MTERYHATLVLRAFGTWIFAIPPNTTPRCAYRRAHVTGDGATLDHIEGDRAVYRVQGSYVFTAD